MPLESSIQRAVIKALREEHGCYVLKVHGNAHTDAGTPDLLVCYGGRFVGMELKQPGRYVKPKGIQAARLRQIEKAGGVAGVVRSVSDALELLRRAAG